MDLLNDFDPSDPVSGLLRAVRLRSTVYCRSVMSAPWGFGVEAHGNPAFHVVTSGSAWLQVEGDAAHLRLGPGDLVVMPTGQRHWVRDRPESPATELEEILAETPLDEDRRLHYGGDGKQTGLLCGGFALEGSGAHPILHALPSTVHIRGEQGRPVPWLAATLTLLSAEAESEAPGAEEVVSRLAEILLTQALRVAFAELAASDGSRVLALRDRQISTAVGVINREPERAWTVGELADRVALSRSAFQTRFRHVVGESPKRYITRSRLAHAAALLRRSDISLAEIAAQIGYASEFSFAKAFKRTFGVAPGVYRGQENSVPGLSPETVSLGR